MKCENMPEMTYRYINWINIVSKIIMIYCPKVTD